jgi:hypothetical protein
MSITSDHDGAIEDLIAADMHTPAVVRATSFAADAIRAGAERTAEDLHAAVAGLDRVLDAYRSA